MTGTVNVNDLPVAYQSGTLLPLILFAIYDIKHHKVRNTALLAFLPWCFLCIPLSWFASGQPILTIIFRSLLGFMTGGLLLLFAALLTGGGIGGGDIKIIALLGLVYGAIGILSVVIIASLTALIVCGIKTILRCRKKERVPFVPYFFIGALSNLLIL